MPNLESIGHKYDTIYFITIFSRKIECFYCIPFHGIHLSFSKAKNFFTPEISINTDTDQI